MALIGEARSTNRPRTSADLARLDYLRGLFKEQGELVLCPSADRRLAAWFPAPIALAWLPAPIALAL
jgi:hypothetical protein